MVGALVARELGATRRAQTLAAVIIGFGPGMLGTNLLFQPVALDQLTTMVVLWLALRLALGRGSWPLLGVAAGIGLETKYTLAVVLVLLIATFLVWRRDVLRTRGSRWPWRSRPSCSFRTSSGRRATAGRACTGSSTRRRAAATRRGRSSSSNVILLTGAAVPVAVAGFVSLIRDRTLRPFGWTIVGTVVAYFVLGGKSYYALPVLLFALAAGAIPLDRWATRRRLQVAGAVFVTVGLIVPTDLAASPAAAYGRPGLPPVASADVTMRYWRPHAPGRKALLVGYTRPAASFCRGYRVVAHISTADDSDEGGEPIVRCTLLGTLTDVWPSIVAAQN